MIGAGFNFNKGNIMKNIVNVKIQGSPGSGKFVLVDIIKKALLEANLNCELKNFDGIRVFDELIEESCFTLANVKGIPLTEVGPTTELYLNNLLDTEQLTEQEAREGEWFFTFGFGQPNQGCYIKFTGTQGEAREKMVNAFGSVWAFQYSAEKFKGQAEKYNLKEIN